MEEKAVPHVVPDMRLRHMHVRACWGSQMLSDSGNVLVKDENVFFAIIGKRLCELKGNVSVAGKYMYPHMSFVQKVLCIAQSTDKSLLGASVCEVDDVKTGLVKAGVLVYGTDHSVGIHRHPKYMQFLPDKYLGARHALGLTFSPDSSYMACYTNLVNDGIFVYDWMLEQLTTQIPISNPINFISFNPGDSSRMCVTGTDELFEFWHWKKSGSHIAPIPNLPDLDCAAYTFHVWLEKAVVLAGTDDGQIVLVQGVEVKLVMNAFGPNALSESSDVAVVGILFREETNTIVVIGEDARMSIFELSKGDVNSRRQGTQLTLLSRHYIAPTSVQIVSRHVVDAHWALTKANSMLLVIGFKCSVEYFEPQRVDYVGDPSVSQLLKPSGTVYDGHTGGINMAALPTRTTNMLTVSSDDSTVRVWNMARENGAVPVSEVYYERQNEMPQCVALHPSGRVVAFGLDESVKEYAILNNSLELLHTMGIRNSLSSKSNESIVNIFAASVVQYSNGGHLLAVATGKYVQIFARSEVDYSRIRAGVSKRVMDLTEHGGNVTNILFSKDDSTIYTSALDGSVFQWNFKWGSVEGRAAGSYQKGAAIMMALSPLTQTLAVLCEVSVDGAPTEATRRFSSRRGSVMNKQNSFSDEGGDGGGGGPLSRGSSSNGLRGQGSMNDLGSPTTLGRRNAHTPKTFRKSSSQYLSLWEGGQVTDLATVMELTSHVVSLVFTAVQGADELQSTEYCFMGLSDGSVLISIMPLVVCKVSVETIPDTISVPGTPVSTASAVATTREQDTFDESTAKSIRLPLCSAAVNVLVASRSGYWVGVFSADGSMYLLATTRGITAQDMSEALSMECGVVMTDEGNLSSQLQRIEDLEGKVTDSKHR